MAVAAAAAAAIKPPPSPLPPALLGLTSRRCSVPVSARNPFPGAAPASASRSLARATDRRCCVHPFAAQPLSRRSQVVSSAKFVCTPLALKGARAVAAAARTSVALLLVRTTPWTAWRLRCARPSSIAACSLHSSLSTTCLEHRWLSQQGAAAHSPVVSGPALSIVLPDSLMFGAGSVAGNMANGGDVAGGGATSSRWGRWSGARSAASSAASSAAANFAAAASAAEAGASSVSSVSPSSAASRLSGSEEAEHLVVLVHGIMATVRDWQYVEGELQKRLGRAFTVYVSSSNEFLLTFQGVDKAGERLASEVRAVAAKRPRLRRVSFVGHSLGGVIARYAIGLLYEPQTSLPSRASQATDHAAAVANSSASTFKERDHGLYDNAASLNSEQPHDRMREGSARGSVAGLEPCCYVSLATPHLGVRGKGQLPFLFGVDFLEKIAAPIAPLLVGRTGRQLFLTDGIGRSITSNTSKSRADVNDARWRQEGEGKDGDMVGGDRLAMVAAASLNMSRTAGSSGKTGGGGRQAEGQQQLKRRRPPLLLRMALPAEASKSGTSRKQLAMEGVASDQSPLEDPPFLRALASFRTRVAYANAGFDHMVGWQTSSIRRPSELPNIPATSISQQYPHVMRVENCTAAPLSAAMAKTIRSAAVAMSMSPNDSSSRSNNGSGGDSLFLGGEQAGYLWPWLVESDSGEAVAAAFADPFLATQEAMIAGLQSMPWRKVDVSFHKGFFPFLAHNNIHVKLHWLHFDGAGVVRHLADTLREAEAEAETASTARSCNCISATLTANVIPPSARL